MEWMQVLTIIGALGAFIMWNTQRLDNDIKSIDSKIDVAHRRMDQLYQTLTQQLNASNIRMEQLYQNLIDILKNGK